MSDTPAAAVPPRPAEQPWLTTLTTATPQAGFDLAVKLARRGVRETQPDDAVRAALRAAYDHDTRQLIAASQVIAVYFQTIAAANDHWRSSGHQHRPQSLQEDAEDAQRAAGR